MVGSGRVWRWLSHCKELIVMKGSNREGAAADFLLCRILLWADTRSLQVPIHSHIGTSTDANHATLTR